MARQVGWLSAGLDDLEAATRYLADRSPRYAAVFARDVLQTAESLAELAARGRIVPELGDPSVRELPVHRYRLIYRVTAASVSILALIHGARELQRAWATRRRR